MEKVCTSVISFFILSGGTAAAEVLIRGEGIVCVCVCVCVSPLHFRSSVWRGATAAAGIGGGARLAPAAML